MLDAKEVHLVVQSDQKPEWDHKEGVVVLGSSVGKGATKDISASTPAGSNGNATNAGPKSQDDFGEMIGF